MDRLHLSSLTNKLFPFPIFFSILPSSFSFLLLSSLLLSSSFVFASVNNSKALSIQHQCIEDHFSALLQLKQGFYTTTLSSWNPDNRDCCSWEGITCDGAIGHVTSLDLSELSISGRIDFVSLFRLQSLQRLNLAYNYFHHSPIPTGFEYLTSLTHLNLSYLHFYGQIPLEISRLTTLLSLDLSFNRNFVNHSYSEYLKLENSSIGAFVQNLSSLRELHLDLVSISAQGSEWGLALSLSLPLLRKLSLSYCGLSGPINPSLSKLHFLSELHLSGNNLSSAIPESIFRLPNLQTLDVGYNPLLTGEIPPNNSLLELTLSDTGFCSNLRDSFSNSKLLTMIRLRDCKLAGQLPAWLVKFQKLMYLDLSNNGFSGPLPSWLVNLDKLVGLDLSSNNLSGPIPSSYGNKFQNLQWFVVSNNSLSGTIPSLLFSLPSLRGLYLGENQFSGQLGEFHNPSSSLLETLVLYNNKLEGPIPMSILELTKLRYLSLSSNNFSGTIPSSLFSLPSLRYLDFSKNQLSGQLGEFHNSSSSLLETIYLNNNKLEGPIPMSIFELTKLQLLYLVSNNFSGTISSSLFSLPSLQYLDLSKNQLSGQLGEFHNSSSSLLETIYLDNNKLEGPIPMSIFELTKLQYLYLSSNNFSGDVDLGLFQNLKNLWSLDLSYNNFSVHDGRSNSSSMSFPQIRYLLLGSCNITKFPNILRKQERINSLDLSNNIINGEIPNWIWNIGNGSLSYLNLSHNALEGLELPFPHLSLSSLKYLDLSFNKLEGSIPIPPPSTIIYSLATNYFSGEVPSHICNCTSLQFLDLSANRFNGSIPLCLGEINDAITVLNLGGNAFHGALIQTFKEGCNLKTLDLNGNQLEGQVPKSLAKCKMLEVLNLGNNQIHDTFPFWLENLSQLRVLILRSNKFHGNVGHPLTNLTFPMLQIFDLSFNSFTGSLPSNMFRSWKVMKEDKSQLMVLGKRLRNGMYYQDKVTLVWKGLQMEVVKILIAFTSIDLSNNEFHGGIPESIGDLKSLLELNMSHNHFTSRIPTSFGNMKALESLDMSQNNLSGEIPLQLNKLTFLAVLNLSHNLLVGSIPKGQQFDTFTNESFLGNLELCGPPLSKKCKDIEALLPPAQSESKYDWKLMAIGFGVGYGVGMGVLFWTLTLWTKGHREYNKFIDKMLLSIFLSTSI